MNWLEILGCPVCHGNIQERDNAYVCPACDRVYPVRFGIPDFRTFPDPYVSIEDEEEKIRKILGDGTYRFEQLVDRYYQFSPEVSADLAPRYRQGLKAGAERAEKFLQQASEKIQFQDGPYLDIGCGTAGLTLVLQRRAPTVGIDIALRWILIGRQRLLDAGMEAPLICANAESLPFRNGIFRTIFCDSALEHTTRPDETVREAQRVAAEGAAFYFNTANRNSLLDAYTGFPLAGLMPARMRCAVITKWCHTPYLATPQSVSQLKVLFRNTADLKIEPFRPPLDAHTGASRLRRLFAKTYTALLDSSFGRRLLVHFGFFNSVSGHFTSRTKTA